MAFKVGDKAWIEYSRTTSGAGALQVEVVATPSGGLGSTFKVQIVAPGANEPTFQDVPERSLYATAEAALADSGKAFGAIATAIKNPGTTFRDALEKGAKPDTEE